MLEATGFDFFYYYIPAANNEFPFYYPYWAWWILKPFLAIPFKFNYILQLLIYLAVFIYIIKETKASPWLLVTSSPFIWVFYYGQFEGLVAIGVVLMWLGVRKEQWGLVALGRVLSSLKPHLSGPLILLSLIWLPT